MNIGLPFMCLQTKDLDASKTFYRTLGFTLAEEVAGQRATLLYGSLRITLMTFLEDNLLNFRGVDAFAIHAHMQSSLESVTGRPERYAKEQYDADADGECWLTEDPDGNAILFDTNNNERENEFRSQQLAQVLRGMERDLINIEAPTECVDAFRTAVLERFSNA